MFRKGRRKDQRRLRQKLEEAARHKKTMSDCTAFKKSGFPRFNPDSCFENLPENPLRRRHRRQSSQRQQGEILFRHSAQRRPTDTPSEIAVDMSLLNQECCICYMALPDGVLMECGHGGVCYKCACQVLSTSCTCHLCRKTVLSVLQIDIFSSC